MREDIRREIELTQGVSARSEQKKLIVTGPKGENSRLFADPKINVRVEEGKVVVEALKGTRREKTVIGSYESHIKNMVQGVCEPFEYKLKICSGHFPMNVTLNGRDLTVKNFIGESVPRKVTLLEGTKVKVSGTDITVVSCNKELAGQNAAKIEQVCSITNKDRRIFQDGIYITEKAGKKV